MTGPSAAAPTIPCSSTGTTSRKKHILPSSRQNNNPNDMQSSSQELSVLEKVGYSLGDLAANLIFQTLLAFLAFFYTDIYKIPPSSASKVMLIGGIIGACF